jgi:hypothetical protein
MDIRDMVKKMASTPRSKGYAPNIRSGSTVPYTEENIAADSLGTLDILKYIDQNQKQYQAEVADIPEWGLAYGNQQIQLAPRLLERPERWRVMNHEIGHLLQEDDSRPNYFPKRDQSIYEKRKLTDYDAAVSAGAGELYKKKGYYQDYGTVSPKEMQAERFAEILHNRFFPQALGINGPVR